MVGFDRIVHFGKPSHCLVGNERHEAPQLVEALKLLLQDRARALVMQADGRLVLRSYSSDGAPV